MHTRMQIRLRTHKTECSELGRQQVPEEAETRCHAEAAAERKRSPWRQGSTRSDLPGLCACSCPLHARNTHGSATKSATEHFHAGRKNPLFRSTTTRCSGSETRISCAHTQHNTDQLSGRDNTVDQRITQTRMKLSHLSVQARPVEREPDQRAAERAALVQAAAANNNTHKSAFRVHEIRCEHTCVAYHLLGVVISPRYAISCTPMRAQQRWETMQRANDVDPVPNENRSCCTRLTISPRTDICRE